MLSLAVLLSKFPSSFLIFFFPQTLINPIYLHISPVSSPQIPTNQISPSLNPISSDLAWKCSLVIYLGWYYLPELIKDRSSSDRGTSGRGGEEKGGERSQIFSLSSRDLPATYRLSHMYLS
ncbi:hypothetical protein F4810DRAFT_547470 [Camillea tinctor]|nr:hypothetical protein F4810DRAFT_547470 [Camillea tinctor]